MAPILDDKPGNQYDDEMGWYHPERSTDEDGLEQAFGAPSATDTNLPENHPSRKKALDDKELSKAEQAGSARDKDSAESKESEGLYSGGESGSKRRFRITKKQGLAGGLVGLIIGGSFGFMSIASGPLKLIHFSQLLQRFHFSNDESFSDSRVGKLYKYMRTKNSPERRNLGKFGNLMANHYEKRLKLAGFEPEYKRGRITGYNVDINTESGSRAYNEMRDAGVPVPEGPVQPGKKILVNLEGESGAVRRKAIRAVTEEAGMSKISTAVASRLGIKRGNVGLFHPIQAINRKAEETVNAYIKKILEKHQAAREKGPETERLKVKGDDTPEAEGEESSPKTDAEGAQAAREGDELSDSAQKAGKEVGEEGQKAAANVEKSVTDKLKGKGAGALAVVSIICGLRALGNEIPKLKYIKMVVPLMRTGMEMISIGSQIQSGQDVSLDEIGVIAGQLYDKTDKTSAFSAASIQAEQGEPITGVDMPEEDKPNIDKPGFFKVIDNLINSVHGGGVCDFVTSTAGGWVTDIVGTALTAGTPVGAFITLISGQLTSIAGGKALAPVMKSLVGWMSGRVLDTYGASGALLGNYANYGARLASNDLSIASGGTELSPAQSAELKVDTAQQIKNDFRSKSLYARYLDPVEPDSLVSKIAFDDSGAKEQVTNLATMLNPVKIFSSMFLGLMPKASAATSYDYGFPEYGFTVQEMDNDRYDDPYANADRVEPHLAELNQKYGEKCFGTTINPDTGAIEPGSDVKHYEDIPAECKDQSNQELTDYRFYLADMKAMRATTCYDGADETACAELGFASQSSSGSGTTATPTDIGNKKQDTSGMACAPLGLTGEQVVPVGDGTIKIKLCDYGGVKGVNASWSNNMSQMIDAAKKAGIDLAGGGFRTAAAQIALRSKNGCPDVYHARASTCRVPTAIPGTSNHELGLAIDYSNITKQCFGGGVSTCPGNKAYEWLTANASKWGIKKLKSEAWHWSVDGG